MLYEAAAAAAAKEKEMEEEDFDNVPSPPSTSRKRQLCPDLTDDKLDRCIRHVAKALRAGDKLFDQLRVLRKSIRYDTGSFHEHLLRGLRPDCSRRLRLAEQEIVQRSTGHATSSHSSL